MALTERLLRKTTARVPSQQLPSLGNTAALNPTTLGARFMRRVRVSLVLHAPRYYSRRGYGDSLCSVGRLLLTKDRSIALSHEQLQAIVVGLPWERLDERTKIRML